MPTISKPLTGLEQYQHFFDIAKRRNKKPSYDFVYFVSLDAEWVYRNPRNHLICYQIACCSKVNATNNFYLVPEGRRPDMAEIADKAIRAANGGVIPEDHLRKNVLICLVAHNATAEFSILADRDKPHVTDAITLVRNSTITLNQPISVTLPGYCQVDVRWSDTMLLAPASHRSLKKLSALLGKESEMKETISQFHIENMDILLEEDPEKFISYALKDTEVTLKLFFLLQESLNQLAFGKTKKLFITIGSAAVELFVRENEWNKEYRKRLKSARFADATRLVKRGYFGGRNEGLLRGRTSNYDSTKDKTWVDIDLKGCYPTTSSRIPRIDLNGDIRLLQTSYLLDDTRCARLIADNVPPELVEQARAALHISTWQFEWFLRDLKNYQPDRLKNSPVDRLKKSQADRIRNAALMYDNSLIEEWYESWQAAKNQPGSELERYLVPGFARISFSFPDNPPLYPPLHVHHSHYGLVYPLSGETVATHMEIMVALDAGAKIDAITSLELPVQRDETGQQVFYVQKTMAGLAKERDDQQKLARQGDRLAMVNEKLLKEFMNSLYGKFAQGVNPRNICRIATYEMDRLEPSKITDPVVAALTTGAARAVLSTLLLAIDKYNSGKAIEDWIAVASCTTDGLLVGFPSEAGKSVLGTFYISKEICNENVPSKKKYRIAVPNEDSDWTITKQPKKNTPTALSITKYLKDFTPLLDKFDEYLPVRLYQNARKEMTGNADYLEVKGMADEVVAVKSRGQIGLLKRGDVTILAKFSVKPPLQDIIKDTEERKFIYENDALRRNAEGKYLLDHFEETDNGRDQIVTYKQYTLPSASKIMKSQGQLDLTQQVADRKLNCDFDMKRLQVVEDAPFYPGGPVLTRPYTVPFATLGVMKNHRYQLENIRRSGRVARIEEVLARVNTRGKKTRAQGGGAAELIRLFIRGLLAGHFRVKVTDTYQEMAEKLTDIWLSVDPAYRCSHPHKKGADPAPPSNPRLHWSATDLKNAARGAWEENCLARTPVLTDLLEKLAAAFNMNPTFAGSLLFEQELNRALMAQVVKAVLCGRHLEPFKRLFLVGQLPGRADLLRAFHPALSPEILTACENNGFTPGGRSPHDRAALIRLFRQLGLSTPDCAAAASVIITPPDNNGRRDRFAVSQAALVGLVTCILQPDYARVGLPHAQIKAMLRPFGMTGDMFDQLKHERFIPHRLANTPKNRSDITQMARWLKQDAAPILAATIDR